MVPPHPTRTARSALILALALAACTDDTAGVPLCTPGRVEACPCPDLSAGTQVCGADGRFGACGPCTGAPDATDTGDAPAPADTSPDATTAPDDVPVIVGDVAADATASDHCDPCGTGEVKGLVCAPSEHVRIPDAHVSISAVDCDGVARTYTTRSAADGTYDFPAIPCGTHEVTVTAGTFSRTYEVAVATGQTTDLSGAIQKLCFAPAAVPMAVFWGQWDAQEDLLRELGFDYTWYDYESDYFDDVPPDEIEAVQVLRDPARLAPYEILFFDCASAPLAWVREFPEIGKNLSDFVLAGGSIYASDLAWAYVEAAFPDAIDFFGQNDLPHGPMAADGPQRAQGQKDYPATIDDATLAAYLGTGAFTTRYGPGPLIAVDAAGPGTTVAVRGIVDVDLPSPAVCGDHLCDGAELLSCSADCAGRLVPDDHASHAGPMVLVHQPGLGAGKVVYTTFHNDEQADALMQKLLYYLVFQL